MSRLQTELDVAKTSTFASRARIMASAGGAMSQGNLLVKRDVATPPAGTPPWSKSPLPLIQGAPGGSGRHDAPSGRDHTLARAGRTQIANSTEPTRLRLVTQALRAPAAPWSALARSDPRQPRRGHWNQLAARSMGGATLKAHRNRRVMCRAMSGRKIAHVFKKRARDAHELCVHPGCRRSSRGSAA